MLLYSYETDDSLLYFLPYIPPQNSSFLKGLAEGNLRLSYEKLNNNVSLEIIGYHWISIFTFTFMKIKMHNNIYIWILIFLDSLCVSVFLSFSLQNIFDWAFVSVSFPSLASLIWSIYVLFYLILPHSALSWIFSLAEDLSRFIL